VRTNLRYAVVNSK